MFTNTGEIKFDYNVTKKLMDVKTPEYDYRIGLSDSPAIESFKIINCKTDRSGLNKKFQYIEILIEAEVNDDPRSIVGNPKKFASILTSFLKEI
jgi:hypothetical protein